MKARKGKENFVHLTKVSRVTFSLNLEWKIKCGAGHGGSDYGQGGDGLKMMMVVVKVTMGNGGRGCSDDNGGDGGGAERQWWWMRWCWWWV